MVQLKSTVEVVHLNGHIGGFRPDSKVGTTLHVYVINFKTERAKPSKW